MSIERRRVLMALPVIMALAAPAFGQDGGQGTGQSSPPTSAEPVRGLEPLQPAGATSAAPIPVPGTPRLVLPNAAPATRQRQPRSTPQRATSGASDSGRRTATPQPAGQAASATGRTRAETATSSRPVDEAAARLSGPASTEPSEGTAAPAQSPTPVEQAPATVPATAPAPAALPAPATGEGPAASIAAPETGRAMPFWLWLAVIVVVGGVVWLLRRGGGKATADKRRAIDAPAPVEPTSAAVPTPAAPATVADAVPTMAQGERAATRETLSPAAAVPVAATLPTAVPSAPEAAEPRFLERRGPDPLRARLAVELRPLRAGLNLLSATASCDVVVTNIGTAVAEGVRVQATLLTAHAGQDADLAAVNAGPVVRPATTPFALAPGETRVVRTLAATAREAIHSMTAANRPMFVPIVAVNVLYASGEIAGQTARAWAIGIERVDSAKLAPFWLDAPARMYDGIAARAHAVAIER